MTEVPIIFNVDLRDATGYGLAMWKKRGDAYVHLIKNDPYESRMIRLDFSQVCSMVDEIRIAERKEKNNRVNLGISSV